jgi:ABC-2 type transport system permease protein
MRTDESGPQDGGKRDGGLARYARLYAALVRYSVTREMQFKVTFLLWIMVELLWFALQLCFMTVLYTKTSSIAGWNKWQVILLAGCSNFLQQLFTAFFLTNLTELSELIRTGKLDFMLLLPVNPRFLISLRKVDLGAFINAGCAVAVMIFAARQLHLHPTAAELASFAILAAAGLLVHYSLAFMLGTIAFWTVRAQGVIWGYYNLFNIARLPAEAFRGAFKTFFTFGLPLLLVSNVPVKVLAEKLSSPEEAGYLLGMSLLAFVVSECVWRRALRQYTSASA